MHNGITLFTRTWREIDHIRFEAKEGIRYISLVEVMAGQHLAVYKNQDNTATKMVEAGRFVIDQLRHNGYDIDHITPTTKASLVDGKFKVEKKRGRPRKTVTPLKS
jgi:hypothetical protein